MDLIELFVKYVNNSNDIKLISEVSSYYKDRALHYWNVLNEYLRYGTNLKLEDIYIIILGLINILF